MTIPLAVIKITGGNNLNIKWIEIIKIDDLEKLNPIKLKILKNEELN